MSVLTVASSNGGPGKTTVCQLLAGSLAGNLRLVMLDADPSQALLRWTRAAYEGPPFEAEAEPDEARLAHLIAAKADSADLVIMDTAGFGNRAASGCHDLGRCRYRPSPLGRGGRNRGGKDNTADRGTRSCCPSGDSGPGATQSSTQDYPRPTCRSRADCGRSSNTGQ
jgi:CobQ/CobB/MinD/ParA nucleotide binding domain